MLGIISKGLLKPPFNIGAGRLQVGLGTQGATSDKCVRLAAHFRLLTQD